MRKKERYVINGIPFVIHKNTLICLEPVFLDIETSNNHADDPKDLITWISSIQVRFNGHYYLLRRPEELMDFYMALYEGLDLKYDPETEIPTKLITYIHNLSYDASYLIPYFIKYLPEGQKDRQGIIEGHNKFLTYQQGCFEWRCSYRLSNMSLYKWSNELNVEHKKQLGLYDYDKIIYQDDDLTEDEQIYDQYDVLAMNECLDKQLEHYGDDLSTVPYTFTGYVRRELRKSCRSNRYYRNKYFIKNRLSPELYFTCLKSYAGGVTHNNRFMKGQTIVAGSDVMYMGKKIHVPMIGHRDFRSHYPSQLTCYLFPMGVPNLLYDIDEFDNDIEIEDILSYYPEYSSWSIIRFYSAEICDKRISMPFMQFSKCYSSNFKSKRLDNGRIIKAEGEWIMYVDNLTLDILNRQYDMEYEVLKVWIIRNEPLPEELVRVIDKYFKDKSDKKNVAHDLESQYGKLDERTISANFDLGQTKVALNSTYGCLSTNPLRDSYEINDQLEFRIKSDYGDMEKIREGLEKYYHGRSNFLTYIVGCTVTALARYELFEFIEAIGYDHVLYVDTDSAFYIKDEETERAIEELNKQKRQTAHSVILDNGKEEFYDEFTTEPDCLAFRGLHSKCYGVITEKGLELTIAGVPARTLIGMNGDRPIYFTREQELSNAELGVMLPPLMALENLNDDFEFHVNAGQSAVYIGATGKDSPRIPTMVNVNGHWVSTAGGCVIRKLESKKIHDSEYDLNSYEYTDLPSFV